MRWLFVGIKVASIVAIMGAIYAWYFLSIQCTGRTRSPVARARWLHWSCRWFARGLWLKITPVGHLPQSGVIVGNHVSYLDILVHSSCSPTVFISKAEVDNWPIFGTLTRWSGTLFIRREVRSDVLRVAKEMPAIVATGTPLTFFPEGTSTDGNGVLPFMPSLLAPIVENQWSVTPAFIRYSLKPGDGVVEDDVAYYRDETVFGHHLFNLLGRRRVYATVVYGEPRSPGADRKALARELREAVCKLDPAGKALDA